MQRVSWTLDSSLTIFHAQDSLNKLKKKKKKPATGHGCQGREVLNFGENSNLLRTRHSFVAQREKDGEVSGLADSQEETIGRFAKGNSHLQTKLQ